MIKQSWLPLAEYSIKHQVSISTLRRRIKTEDIQYRFDDGKYLILDDVNESSHVNSAQEHRPSLKSDVQNKQNNIGTAQTSQPTGAQANTEMGESVLTAANRLLSDLKKAYTQVLQEKEQHIHELKVEINDLKTLIKVLESENNRYKNN